MASASGQAVKGLLGMLAKLISMGASAPWSCAVLPLCSGLSTMLLLRMLALVLLLAAMVARRLSGYLSSSAVVKL